MSIIDPSSGGAAPRHEWSGIGAAVTNRVAAWLRQMEAAGFGIDGYPPHAQPARAAQPAPGHAHEGAGPGIADGWSHAQPGCGTQRAPEHARAAAAASGFGGDEDAPRAQPARGARRAPAHAHAAAGLPDGSEPLQHSSVMASEPSSGALQADGQRHSAQAEGGASKHHSSWHDPHDSDVAMARAAGPRFEQPNSLPDDHVAVAAARGLAGSGAGSAAGTVAGAPAVEALAARGVAQGSAGAQLVPAVPSSLSAPLARGAASALPANSGAAVENPPSEPMESAPGSLAAGSDQEVAAQQVHVQRRADGVDVWFRDAGLQPYQVYRVVSAWLSDAYANGLRPRTVTVNGSIAFNAARTEGGDGTVLFETGLPAPVTTGTTRRVEEKRYAG